MTSETKNCQNCKNQFVIEPDDFDFYKKVAVPPPTFCPMCRLERRLMVRNERNFYKRTCDLCKTPGISMYSTDKQFPVYCSACWWSDKWDPMEYGRAYDFSRPFFAQMKELIDRVPRPSLRCTNTKNSDYCNYVADAKNCYLCFGSIEVEDCLYGCPYNSKYCVDTYLARECEYCYECIDCEKLSRCSFCQECATSLNLLYCYDCKNCQDCIGCVGLRNKQYHIFNEPFSKDEFLKKKEEIATGGSEALARVAAEFAKVKERMPHRFATTMQCTGVSGDHIVQSKNAKSCFDVKRTEDTKYSIRLIDAKDTYDTNYCEYLELCCDYLGFWKVQRVKFSNTCGEGSDMTYCDFCSGSSNLFGCVGLRGKQYCLFNRQYEKQEYEVLVKKIIAQMGEMEYQGNNGRVYRYGEYFPAEISPLCYNESVAQDFFPLTREEVLSQGYAWKEPEERRYSVTKQPTELLARIEDVPDSILQDVIGCAHSTSSGQAQCNDQCTTAFKIIEPELQFYRRMNLPLPRLCPNCRHYQRLAKRTPFKLWHRQCMCDKQGHAHAGKCPNEFETSYSPNRPEIIYCEQCYNAEVA
jgi:hypothetical protein